MDVDIPEGDCDCDGNRLDALGGVAGTAVDADADGICDDEDDCVGAFDACGGATVKVRFTGGCTDILEDYDCKGNQLDALGVCGGDCETDDNGDGICDSDCLSGFDGAAFVMGQVLFTRWVF